VTQHLYSFDGPDTSAGAGVPSPAGLPSLVAYVGSWRRLGNRAYTDTPASSRPMLGFDAGGHGNFDLSARVSAGGGDALYARWVDASNWLCARVRTFTEQVPTTSYQSEYSYSTTAGPDGHTHTEIGYPQASNFQHTHGFVGLHDHNYILGAPTGNTRPVYGTTTQTRVQVVFEKSVSGQVTTLGVAAADSGLTSLRMRGVGSTLTVLLNRSATAAITVTDDVHATATKHGIGRGPSELTGSSLDDLFLDNLNNPPFAPSIYVPPAVDLTRDLIINVPFNDPDVGDSALESFVQVRNPSVSTVWTTHRRTGPSTAVTIPADTFVAGRPEIRAASRDAQGLPVGDENLVWSASQFTQAGVPPNGLSLTDPAQGADIGSSSYLFRFSVGTATVTSIEWRLLGSTDNKPDPAKVIDPGGIISDPGVRTFLGRGMPNGSTVHVQLRGYDGALAGDWVTGTFQVAYTRPTTPSFVLTFATRPAAINLRVVNPVQTGGEPRVVENRIRVRIAGRPGSAKLMARVGPGGIWTWRQFASGIDYEFEVEAVAENGTVSLSDWTSAGLAEAPNNEGVYADAFYDPASYA